MNRDEGGAAGGIALALLSAGSFALSGSFASALFRAGWSPGAAVTVRILIAAALLVGPSIRTMRGRWHLMRRNVHLIVLFGFLAVAGAQLFYFNAVQTLSVGVALMLEYMGLVLVVAWQWIASGHKPRWSTITGVLLALFGLVLILDLFGELDVDVVGVLWGLGAAVGLATYFVIAGNDRSEVPPLVMAASGMTVGAAVLSLLGVLGVLPMHASTNDVQLLGAELPWYVALIGLGLVSGAIAYATGVAAARLLGAKVSAFLGLTEVIFAVLFAWLLLGQLPRPIQLAGGALILIGIVVVRREQLSDGVDTVETIGAEVVGAEPVSESDR